MAAVGFLSVPPALGLLSAWAVSPAVVQREQLGFPVGPLPSFQLMLSSSNVA